MKHSSKIIFRKQTILLWTETTFLWKKMNGKKKWRLKLCNKTSEMKLMTPNHFKFVYLLLPIRWKLRNFEDVTVNGVNVII